MNKSNRFSIRTSKIDKSFDHDTALTCSVVRLWIRVGERSWSIIDLSKSIKHIRKLKMNSSVWKSRIRVQLNVKRWWEETIKDGKYLLSRKNAEMKKIMIKLMFLLSFHQKKCARSMTTLSFFSFIWMHPSFLVVVSFFSIVLSQYFRWEDNDFHVSLFNIDNFLLRRPLRRR